MSAAESEPLQVGQIVARRNAVLDGRDAGPAIISMEPSDRLRVA